MSASTHCLNSLVPDDLGIQVGAEFQTLFVRQCLDGEVVPHKSLLHPLPAKVPQDDPLLRNPTQQNPCLNWRRQRNEEGAAATDPERSWDEVLDGAKIERATKGPKRFSHSSGDDAALLPPRSGGRIQRYAPPGESERFQVWYLPNAGDTFEAFSSTETHYSSAWIGHGSGTTPGRFPCRESLLLTVYQAQSHKLYNLSRKP